MTLIKNNMKLVSGLNTTKNNTQNNTQRENRKLTPSHSVTPLGLGAMLGGVLIALVLLLAACPDSNGGGSGNTTYAYTCANGTAADGTTDANNIQRCTSCNDGFKLHNEQCIATKYTCNNGTPTEGTPSGNLDIDGCKYCNEGYFIPDGTVVCAREGEYFCQNGTARPGSTGSTEAVHQCVRCVRGYAKRDNNQCTIAQYICSNGIPVSGYPFSGSQDIERCQSCQSNYIITPDNRCNYRYVCNNGTPTENTDATSDNVTQCASCTEGYTLDGVLCRLVQYTCSNGIPVDGGPSSGTQDVENCQSCSGDYLLAANNICTDDFDGDGILNATDVDDDNDGLIDISTLTMLHNMRYNLRGTSYKTSNDDAGSTAGAPTANNKATDYACSSNAGLCGYELTRNLSFDTGTGGTWSGTGGTYTLDINDNNVTYFPVSSGAGGWLPIGEYGNPFSAIFEGNGYTISHLAIRRNQSLIGMFARIHNGAVIRNVGLINNLADYTGNSGSDVFIGGLVGLQSDATISNSYATGPADSGDGNFDRVGGLVGEQNAASVITSSYATGNVNGGTGNSNRVGGLVGQQYSGNSSISSSYATGAVDGEAGNDDFVGGLVGLKVNGSITNSYASGTVDGSNGAHDRVGGLVGEQTNGSIAGSRAEGVVDGGEGNDDYTGGLVGLQNGGSISASYATGNINGNIGRFDYVGGLVGQQKNGSITASYADGTADGGEGNDDHIGGLVGVQNGGSITASYATGSANGGIGNLDYTGGLVGRQNNGSITASYANGPADGGEGNDDYTGGLVGRQNNGSITASYATGSANGGEGNNDDIGGLVGLQQGGSITASYATGSANGGLGTGDNVGKLIGRRTGGSHSASYGFGSKDGENNGIDASTLPTGITTAVALTAANLTGCVGIANEKAYTTTDICTSTTRAACMWSTNTCSNDNDTTNDININCRVFTTQSTCLATTKAAGTWNGDVWNAAGSNTAGAWNFGTSNQAPALKYSDYDGSGNDYNCNQFTSNITCGTTLLPGQR